MQIIKLCKVLLFVVMISSIFLLLSTTILYLKGVAPSNKTPKFEFEI